MIFLLSLFATPAKSQVIIALLFGDKLNSDKLEFGLMAGPNFSYISNSNANGKAGLGLGLYFNVKLSDDFFFHPEALPKYAFGGKDIPVYSLNDANLDAAFQNGSITRHMSYISLPLLMRYRITGLLFAEAGPQIGLRTKVKDVFIEDDNGGKLEFTKDVSDEYTRFDLGVAGGLVIKLKKDAGMGIGVRYYQGFTDVMKTATGSQQNSGLLAYVSFPVGAGKKK
jgi:hypothetical protein